MIGVSQARSAPYSVTVRNSVVVSIDVTGDGGTPSSVMVVGGGCALGSVTVIAGGGIPGSVMVTYSISVSVKVSEQLEDGGRASVLRGRVVVVAIVRVSLVVTKIVLDIMDKYGTEAVPGIVCVSEVCWRPEGDDDPQHGALFGSFSAWAASSNSRCRSLWLPQTRPANSRIQTCFMFEMSGTQMIPEELGKLGRGVNKANIAANICVSG